MTSPVQYVFGNFFETELTVGVTAAGTVLLVPPSATAALPVCDSGVPSQAQLTLWDGVLPPEIVTCTTNTQNGSLTVVRAQEGTTAQAWGAGTQIRSSLTALVINSALQAYFDIQVVLASAFLPLTGGTLTGALTLAGDPALALQAATKQYVDNVQGNKLPLTGGTMQGTINMNNNRIVSLPAPVTAAEPARLLDVQNEAALRLAYDADNSGKLLTAGSGSAYTVTSNSAYAALVDGIAIRTKLHTLNLRGATLAVDTTAAKPIQVVPGGVLPAGALQANTPVSFVYSLSFDSWLVVGVQQAWFTGDVKLSMRATPDPGWRMCDDTTIGNISSGANFADASAQDLYTLLWTNVSNTNAPVSTGRGASALTDWNAQKTLKLTVMLGRALALAGSGSGLTVRALGDAFGEENHPLTIAELAAHNHPVNITDTHAHTVQRASSSATYSTPGGGGAFDTNSPVTTGGATSGSITAASTNTGSGTGHNTMQPTGFLNAMIKL